MHRKWYSKVPIGPPEILHWIFESGAVADSRTLPNEGKKRKMFDIYVYVPPSMLGMVAVRFWQYCSIVSSFLLLSFLLFRLFLLLLFLWGVLLFFRCFFFFFFVFISSFSVYFSLSSSSFPFSCCSSVFIFFSLLLLLPSFSPPPPLLLYPRLFRLCLLPILFYYFSLMSLKIHPSLAVKSWHEMNNQHATQSYSLF